MQGFDLEWLEADGRGGFAMGTAAGVNTRRYHALLVAATTPPTGRVVLVNGYIYGYNDSILTCLEFASGKMMWRDRSVGKGAVTYADGHLYILSENNVVGLVEATPAGYREKGRFSIADQGWPSWAHPVVSGGRLYIRNQGTLTSYDVRAR